MDEKIMLEKNLRRLSDKIDDIRDVVPKLLDIISEGKPKHFDLFAIGGEGETISSNIPFPKYIESKITKIDRDINISVDAMTRVRIFLEMNKKIFSRLPTEWPVLGGGYVSSEFGIRNNPFHFNKEEMHEGIDIAFYPGAPIVATADGTVVSAKYDPGFGNCITILHSFGFITRYAHCQSIKVREGQNVRRGQIIATIGRTGRTTGYHLHYEIRIAKQPVDPIPFILKRPMAVK